MHKKISILTSLVLVFASFATLIQMPAASAEKKDEDETRKVLICHFDNNVKKPYGPSRIEVDASSVDGVKKGDHLLKHTGPIAYSKSYAQTLKDAKIHWGDIIPAIEGVTGEGLNWTDLGQAMWKFDCQFVAFVVPEAVTFVNPTCGLNSGSYTIPTTKGVKYYIDTEVVAAGTYPVTENITITVTPKAKIGSFIENASSYYWTNTFTLKTTEDCVQGTTSVIPKAVTFVNPTCELNSGSYTIPTTAGVKYYIDDEVVVAGTYPVTENISVTVVAKAETGYSIESESTDEWLNTFTLKTTEDCVQGTNIKVVTPPSVTFTPPTCSAIGYYTIPALTGVAYKVNNQIVAAGNHTMANGSIVTVVASALQGYELTKNATNQWTYTFNTPNNCGSVSDGGSVLGISTATPTTLPVTSGASDIASLAIISAAAGVITMLGFVAKNLLARQF